MTPPTEDEAGRDSLLRELARLGEENTRLAQLLRASGIRYDASPTDSTQQAGHGIVSQSDKIRLFSSLFRVREDVFALRTRPNSSAAILVLPF